MADQKPKVGISSEAPKPVNERASASPTPSSSSRNSKKRYEEKYRKKDPRSWENLTKATAAMNPEQKLSQIESRYRELYNEVRDLTQSNKQLTQQCGALQKDRDYQQGELAKSVMGRSRLENLCRELQKQNKQIKEENLAKIKEEEERRKEVSLKFADKLSDINNMMDENKEKSEKLREENIKMTAKLAELYEQFQKREDDITKMSQQLDLERQYSQATMAKMDLELQAEKELHGKEQALMRSNLEKSEANCTVLLETVKGLQDHIDVYKGQYEDFEATMSKSAKVFDNFKFEIANMTKQVTTLEKESQTWKGKFNETMKALVEVSEMKKNQEMHLQGLEKKNEQLQKLCRQIQVDRANFLKLLKSHGIDPETNTLKDKEEDSKKIESPKMTKKEKELQILKNSLQAMQDELTKFSVEEVNKNEDKKTDNETSPVIIEQSAKVSEEKSVLEPLETAIPDSVSSQVACANENGDVKVEPNDSPVEEKSVQEQNEPDINETVTDECRSIIQ